MSPPRIRGSAVPTVTHPDQSDIVDSLLAEGILDAKAVEDARAADDEAEESRGALYHLIRVGEVTPQRLERHVANMAEIEVDPINLEVIEIDEDLWQEMVSTDSVRRLMYEKGIVPAIREDGYLTVAMLDPRDRKARRTMDLLVRNAGIAKGIRPLWGDAFNIHKLLDEGLARDLPVRDEPRLIDKVDDFMEELLAESPLGPARSWDDQVENAPVVRFVNWVLDTAIQEKASDIHFEFYEGQGRVRLRIDGTLSTLKDDLPPSIARQIISRIKVLSGLTINERGLPQDGRFSRSAGGREVDFRVSTLPSTTEESVVLRVLDRAAVRLDLDWVGLQPELHEALKRNVASHTGLVLVTGPTGSGKTTTLYSILNHLSDSTRKIITTEDPVELKLNGIIQVPVSERLGFADALESILRQDPDVVMVGEIRNPATAHTAVQAAMTGHLLVSTMQTKDAPTAIARLLDLGVEPFLVADTLEVVMAQRLVRILCSSCKEPAECSDTELRSVGAEPDEMQEIYKAGPGCDACVDGYIGRTLIHEHIEIDDPIRDLILAKAGANEIRTYATQEMGMKTLRDAGLELASEGTVSLNEVVRLTPVT